MINRTGFRQRKAHGTGTIKFLSKNDAGGYDKTLELTGTNSANFLLKANDSGEGQGNEFFLIVDNATDEERTNIDKATDLEFTNQAGNKLRFSIEGKPPTLTEIDSRIHLLLFSNTEDELEIAE